MFTKSIAVIEMERLKGAHAFNLVAKPTKVTHNQFGSRYIFEDNSILRIYVNGDASWEAPGNGEQRWPNWHHCNARGSN